MTDRSLYNERLIDIEDMEMERDEILVLAQHNPEALVTIIQRQEEKIQRLDNRQ